MEKLDKTSKSKREGSTKMLIFLGLLIVILFFLVIMLVTPRKSSAPKKNTFSASSRQSEKQMSPELLQENLITDFFTANEKFKKIKVRKYRTSGAKKRKYYNFEISTAVPSSKVERAYFRIFEKSGLEGEPSGDFVFEDNLKKISTTENKVYYQINWEPELEIEFGTLMVWIGYVTEADQREEVFFELPED